MDQIAALPPKADLAVLDATFKVLTPLLIANSSAILSVPNSTHAYGTHARQKLDLYLPPSLLTSPTDESPILIFFYGGGLTQGDKILDAIPNGLVYHNLGAFFGLQGFTTIIADYRRVNDPKLGSGEDAVYPSGGEDISAVISWLNSTYLQSCKPENKRVVFLMGNSAGGIHVSTFLLDPRFEKQRTEDGKVRLAGAVLLSVALDFEQSDPARASINETYFPASLSTLHSPNKKSSHDELCGVGLLRSLGESVRSGKTPITITPADFGIPEVLAMLGEFDPEDEMVNPNIRFAAMWKSVFGEGNRDGTGNGLQSLGMKGHNHFSPFMALMSGDGKAESWGVEVANWMWKKIVT